MTEFKAEFALDLLGNNSMVPLMTIFHNVKGFSLCVGAPTKDKAATSSPMPDQYPTGDLEPTPNKGGACDPV